MPMYELRPACQGLHDPRHWKAGQSPRANRRALLRGDDPSRPNLWHDLCWRCLAVEHRNVIRTAALEDVR